MINYLTSLATLIALFAAMAASFNLLIGFGRLFSIAHAAFVGIGAYAVGIGVVNLGLPFPVAVLAGVAVGALGGFVIGAVALRVADDYLAIATFAFQFVFTVAITNLRGVTGGAYGIPGIPRPSIGVVAASTRWSQLLLGLVVLGVTLEVTRRLKASPFGLNLRAAGEDELAARALGQRTKQAKVTVHTIAGALAALAGAFYASNVGFILPEMFDIHFSILLLSMVIIGGAGSIIGPVVGAALMVALPDLLNFVGATSSTVAYVRQAMFGLVLLLVVVLLQRGIVRAKPFSPTRELHVTAADAEAEDRTARRVPVYCDDLRKAFGGVTAVDGVTAEFAPGTVTGIVGPNGAGKTTLFDLVTGFVTPDSGHVHLNGQAMDAYTPDARCRAGLVRSFQNLRLFPRLTVLENVMISVPLGAGEGALRALLSRRRTHAALEHAAHRAADVLTRVGLTQGWTRRAADLSYAEQKLLSLARVLASEPTAVLLDEPASGLDPRTLGTMAGLVRELASEGRAVCVVEHNTAALKDMADVMLFLHLGRVLSSGSPEEIMADEELASIYFGVKTK